MMRRLSSERPTHWERRSRGLDQEIDRMIWERLLRELQEKRTVPAPVPVPASCGPKQG